MERMHQLTVYETPTHFYIIGSDPSGSRFRTLKIDRVSECEFLASEPDHDYSRADIGELLATVSSSSIVTPSEKWSRRRNNCAAVEHGLLRTVDKAFGLIGAVRFLHGYYLLLVSRAKPVSQIGFHQIYKVEDVSMIYIPTTGVSNHPDELKYSKMFQSVDFTTNFYFSYTYQLSRTLQENCLAERNCSWNRNHYAPAMAADSKFVWNDFLLEPFRKNMISQKWSLELVHGYVGHQLVELPCAKLDLILLARRSTQFAGCRFLKRGTNRNGDVANDVESEQIVWDSQGPMSLKAGGGKFSSFVQRRGSVPLFWSQGYSTHRSTGSMVVGGKPPIVIDRVEGDALSAAKHFRDLRRKYGHPIIVLNLVKRNEHRHNECLLHELFLKTVRYLNQFRRPGRCIDYISFDVSKCNKKGRVLQRLEQLGQRTVQLTGWFQTFPQMKSRSPPAQLINNNTGPNSSKTDQPLDWCSSATEETIGPSFTAEQSSDGQMLLQHGIVRSNCVDCLDRTNVAQFGVGKVALGWQLFSMGLLDSPSTLGLNTELCRHLEELYDEHGDTLAWQYAGSQLVHSIKTYKRTAVLQERSRDVLQTLSRYYSNTFSDFDKQDGINLFLGLYRPMQGSPPIWSLGTDHYLHFPVQLLAPKSDTHFLRWSLEVSSDNEDEDDEWLDESRRKLRDWMLQKAEHEPDIRVDNNIVKLEEEDPTFARPDEDDLFTLAHRTFELTSLDQLLKANQQMQLRRPIVLDALDQSTQQGSSFMRMFKMEHSPSPPPPLTPASSRKTSSTLVQQQTAFSSLAAGTASILRGNSPKRKNGDNNNSDQRKNGENGQQTDENDEEEDEEQQLLELLARQRQGATELPRHSIPTLDDPMPPLLAAQQHCAGRQLPPEAAMAVPAVEEDGTDLLFAEDRNSAEQMAKDPLRQFLALLNGDKSGKRRHQIAHRPPHGFDYGLKNPFDAYFSLSTTPTTASPVPAAEDNSTNRSASPILLAIPDKDIKLYTRYASAAHFIFERHNQRQRQRRPTVWRLPQPTTAPAKRQAIAGSDSPSPATTRQRQPPKSAAGGGRSNNNANSFSSSTPMAVTSRPSQRTAPNHNSNKKPSTPPQQHLLLLSSPLRKDFCRLGPMFEFRPSLFTVDNAFHTELGEMPEESLFLYRKAAELEQRQNGEIGIGLGWEAQEQQWEEERGR